MRKNTMNAFSEKNFSHYVALVTTGIIIELEKQKQVEKYL